MVKTISRFFILFIFSLNALQLSAESVAEDSSADLKIKADNQDIDYKNNTLHFNGNVIVSQENITIKADELFVSTENGNGEKLIATGKPALFTQSFANEEDLIAKADQIIYLVEKQLLKLNGNATFEQGGSVVQSGTIEFDLNAKLVKADGDQSTGGRVTTTLKTKKQLSPEN